MFLVFELDAGSDSKRKNRTVAEALQGNKWIQDIAYALNDTLLSEFFHLWTLLLGCGFNNNKLEEDKITWTSEASGEYSARSAYQIQFSGHCSSLFPKMIWKIWAPARCKFSLAATTKQNLDSRSATATKMAQ
jgi:hypothetical protein